MTAGPEIRPAEPDDADAVWALVQNAYQHYVDRIGQRPGPMDDDYARHIAAGQAWVLAAGGDIVGLVVLEDRPKALLLNNVAVAPAAQGKGYGRHLIAFAESEARRRGYGTLLLYTHALMTENRALYQRLGFVEIRHLIEQGFDRVYMAKRLP